MTHVLGHVAVATHSTRGYRGSNHDRVVKNDWTLGYPHIFTGFEVGKKVGILRRNSSH
jgi:hypothetical protein